MVLLLYLVLLGSIAVFTAYTRNYQRTVIEVDRALDAGGRLVPPSQVVRTMIVASLWPAAFLIGLAFVAWWKAVAMVVGSYVLLTPLLGSFTPRPMSGHFLSRLRLHLGQRIDTALEDRAELERIDRDLARLISRPPSP